MTWPVFTLDKTGKRIAVNPAQVTAVYDSTTGLTEIYTLDCSKADDCWDVREGFDEVLSALNLQQEEHA